MQLLFLSNKADTAGCTTRFSGFVAGVNKKCPVKNQEVAAATRIGIANNDGKRAKLVTKGQFEINSELDTVIACTEELAVGAFNAHHEYHKITNQVLIGAFDVTEHVGSHYVKMRDFFIGIGFEYKILGEDLTKVIALYINTKKLPMYQINTDVKKVLAEGWGDAWTRIITVSAMHV
jgi:ABC-type sugar transport system substrate-binding protein